MKLPRLREWRERRGYTQRGLAGEARVSERSVAGYEAGRNARPNTARRLALVLEIAPEDLMDMEGEEEPGWRRRGSPAPAPPPFSIGWTRAADEDEFHTLLAEAPSEATGPLKELFVELNRVLHHPIKRELARRNDSETEEDDGFSLGPGEWGLLRTRRDALRRELDRRRPPVARVKTWAPSIGRVAEVRWLVPEEARHIHRARVEQMLEGAPYIDAPAAEADEASPQEVAVYA
ncbi:MAG: helix-turn-helix transcriptional regulator [Rubrobacteraceae bacterium]